MATHCRLCQAFAASEFETSATGGLEGSDTFTRDPDVCDACLGRDFAQNPHILELFSVQFGLLAGLVIGVLLYTLKFWPVNGSPILSIVILISASTISAMLVIWLGLQTAIRVLAARRHKSEAEQVAEAERFYYLALWGALTGNCKFKRRMLAKSTRLGFNDATRLSDPRLRNVELDRSNRNHRSVSH